MRASKREGRFSVPFFFQPNYDVVVSPLPGCEDYQVPNKYNPIRWGDFRAMRYLGDYADIGEEIQIEHYLVKDE